MSEITNNYQVENGVLIEYSGKDSIVEIPAGVTKIAMRAFGPNSHIKQVIVPEGVIELEGQHIPGGVYGIFGAFDSCYNLENIQLPSTLKIIGDCAFASCKNLKRIEIPDSVTHISTCAFADCNKLEDIIFSKNIEEIGEYAFQRCSSLKQVFIDNPECIIKDCAFVSSGVTEASIPTKYGLNSIFTDCTQLRKVTLTTELLKNSIPCSWHVDEFGNKTILDYRDAMVFLGIKKNDSLIVSAPKCAIDQMGDAKTPALVGMAELLQTGVTIDETLEEGYVKYAKRQARRLVSTAIENHDLLYFMLERKLISDKNINLYLESAQKVGNSEIISALLEYNTKHFSKLDFVEKAESEFKKIEKAENATSSEMKNTLAYINKFFTVKEVDGIITGNMVGTYKGNDAEIIFPTEVKERKIEGIANRMKPVPQSYGTLERVIIPEGYKYIGKNAFKGCSSLREIDLPSTLEIIEDEAFADCISLERIILPINMNELGKKVFINSGIKEIYVKSNHMHTIDKSWYSKCPLKAVYLTGESGILSIPPKYIKKYPEERLLPIEKLFLELSSHYGSEIDTEEKQMRNLYWEMELPQPINPDLNVDDEIDILFEMNKQTESVIVKTVDGRIILEDAMKDIIKCADSVLGLDKYKIINGKMLPLYDEDYYAGEINPCIKTIEYSIQIL